MGFTSRVYKFDRSAEVNKEINNMLSLNVYIGIPANSKKREKEKGEKPIANAQLGYIHEFGEPRMNIPPRPFLRPGVKDATHKTIEIMQRGGQSILSGKSDTNKVLSLAGFEAVNYVKKRITNSIDLKPITAGTLARRKLKTNGKNANKKFSGERPLLDTAQMLNSITYIVDKKNRKKGA